MTGAGSAALRPVDVIARKRRGGEHPPEELHAWIQAYVRGEVPDYQMSAWLMAVCFQGMTPQETAALTQAMAASGARVDLSGIPGIKVDKHSSGGVGDKTTLVLAPLVAACGAPVAKMSGRGLGHTGGTIDKLESIPGFRTELEIDAFRAQLARIGVAIAAQTAGLAPADRLLYALRDVTATVESLPLIASSIMSKKIAGGADALVLDVKTGSGAFMPTRDEAVALARAMVEIGRHAGLPAVALVTGMQQPLGNAIGNALEVREAIAALQGQGPADLIELCLVLGSEMLQLAGIARTAAEAEASLRRALETGAAWAKLEQLVAAQGGDVQALQNGGAGLPAAPLQAPAPAPSAGCIKEIDARALGEAAVVLGAGRAKKGDAVDPAVGITLLRKVGDRVERGEPLAVIHARSQAAAEAAAARAVAAIQTSDQQPLTEPLVQARVT